MKGDRMRYLLIILLLVGCGAEEKQKHDIAVSVSVVNSGVSGSNTEDVIGRIDDIILMQYELAIIMVGTNDSLNSWNSINIGDYEKNLTEIVVTLKANGYDVLLLTIPPAIDEYLIERHGTAFFDDSSGVNNKIMEYNYIIKSVAMDNKITVYDTYMMVMENGGAYIGDGSCLRNELNRGDRDGVHLTSECYIIMAEELSTLVEAYGLIVSIGDSITFGVHEQTSYPSHLEFTLNN